MKTKLVHGQPSWHLAGKTVEAYVTELGGHLAPVTFKLGARKVQPFAIAPWATEKVDPKLPAILRALRGDFFCMPFGGNTDPYRGERHPVHGETANAKWTLKAAAPGHLHLRLRTKVRAGTVDKHLFVRDGHPVIYQRHVISGMSGSMNFGHHATLRFPDEPGSGIISTSRFVCGQVFPDWFERPENRGYQSLKPGAEFESIRSVPMLTGETADLSRYPARRGFEDLIMLVGDPRLKLGWNAVTFPKQRHVWFALRDPQVLTGTLFWITNGGRHMPPWDGRHINTMGIEDVTSYFHIGLAQAAGENPYRRRGYATCAQLNPSRPLVVNYIMGVAGIPAGFDEVADIVPVPGGVELRAKSGKSARVKVAVDFLRSSDNTPA